MSNFLYEKCFHDSEKNTARIILQDGLGNIIEDINVLFGHLFYDLNSKKQWNDKTYRIIELKQMMGSDTHWEAKWEDVEHYKERNTITKK